MPPVRSPTVDAALALLPGDKNLRFVRAGALAGTGATDAAADELRALVAEHPTWEVAIRGFADKGLVTLPDGLTIDGILERRDREQTGPGPRRDAPSRRRGPG